MLSDEDYQEIFDRVENEQRRTHEGVSSAGIDFIISELEETIKSFKRVRSAELNVKNIELFSYYTNIIEKMLDNAASMARYCKSNTEPYYESPEVRLERQKAEMEQFGKIYDAIQEMRDLPTGSNT